MTAPQRGKEAKRRGLAKKTNYSWVAHCRNSLASNTFAFTSTSTFTFSFTFGVGSTSKRIRRGWHHLHERKTELFLSQHRNSGTAKTWFPATYPRRLLLFLLYLYLVALPYIAWALATRNTCNNRARLGINSPECFLRFVIHFNWVPKTDWNPKCVDDRTCSSAASADSKRSTTTRRDAD